MYLLCQHFQKKNVFKTFFVHLLREFSFTYKKTFLYDSIFVCRWEYARKTFSWTHLHFYFLLLDLFLLTRQKKKVCRYNKNLSKRPNTSRTLSKVIDIIFSSLIFYIFYGNIWIETWWRLATFPTSRSNEQSK